MILPSKPVLIIAGLGVAGALAYIAARKAGQTFDNVTAFAGTMLNEVSPFNNDNIFYTGVNSAGTAVTGNKDFSLGVAVYDALHVGEYDELSIFSPDGIRHMVFGDKDKTIWNFWK